MHSPPLGEGVREGRDGTLAGSSFNTRWLAELGIDPRVIIDAGSYDGGDAYRFQQEFPQARVVAIEAEPARQKIVRQSLADTPVTIVEAAVGDRDGEADWYTATHRGRIDAQGSLYRQTERMNRRTPDVRQVDRPTRVKTMRLDTLCRKFGIAEIDFLHMDIQGAEYVALEGLGSMRPKLIFLEITKKGWIGAASPEKIHSMLTRRGYVLAAALKSDRLYFRSATASMMSRRDRETAK